MDGFNRREKDSEVDRQILEWSEKSERGSIPEDLRISLINKFKQVQKMGADPYQTIVYSIMAATDMVGGSYTVLRSIEDFLWHKLRIIRDSGAGSPGQTTLGQLVANIQEWGVAHFTQQGQLPFQYVTVCLLTQQWAAAIQYLQDQKDGSLIAIHMALCLYHYGIFSDISPSRGDSDPKAVDVVGMLKGFIGGMDCRDMIAHLLIVHKEAPVTKGPNLYGTSSARGEFLR